MKIERPQGMADSEHINITITDDGQKAKIWQDREKETVETARSFTGADLPKVIWIEGLQKSAALRDVELKLTWQEKNKVDTIKLTFVWVEFSKWRVTPNGKIELDSPAEWADCNGATIKATYAQLVDENLGLTIGAVQGIRNTMQMEFQVWPAGIGQVSGVKFDVSRKADAKIWAINGGAVQGQVLANWPGQDEQANDDSSQDDEDNIPNNNRIYSIDGPGHPANVIAVDELILRANFEEFVRVKFDNNQPAGNGVSGSRCSDGRRWRAIVYTKNSGVGNVQIRNCKTDAVFGAVTPPGRAGAALNDQKAKNCEAKTEDWTLTYKGANKWSVSGTDSGNQPDATTNVNYKSDTGGIEFTITNAAYQQNDQFTFSTTASTPMGASATTPVSNPNPGPGGMTAVTVDDAKTMSEDWVLEYDAAAGNWTVTGTQVPQEHPRASTGVEYDIGKVKFTINAGAYQNGHKFTFSTRRARENEIEMETDQNKTRTDFEKPIETH